MTGNLIACRFADAGVSVTLLEAGLVGRGSTAASSALLLYEPDRGMAELARRYGARPAKRIWQLSQDGVRDLVALLKHKRIDCDLVGQNAIYYATSREAAANLRAEFRLRARAGFEGAWLTSDELRRVTGIVGHGAIRTRGNARFDPYRACLGLARAAARAGAHIYERSTVGRIDPRRHGVRLHTDDGRVDAERVVIATGYATARFRPMAGRFRLYRTYVVGTEPLSGDERRELGLSDVMIWDTERPYHYARWTSDRRLLLGGGDQPARAGKRRDAQFTAATRHLREYFHRVFPALTNIEIQHSWEGVFAMTSDGLPYIGPHRQYPGHLFALGYGGNGMTFGSLAARLLLEQWQDIPSPDHRLFRFGRLR
jgi:glycine/D-amino acid oxidase-like deaminating enzyme